MKMKSLLKRLKVSRNKRFLVDETDAPFFWLADTAWELIHRLTKEECEFYLTTRASQKFTVIQAVVLAELDGLRTPNAEGELPLENEDPMFPREAYFKHIDWMLNKAASLGLYIGLLPTWGDKVNQRYDWAKGPEVFTKENAQGYGQFLGERYRDFTNIIWILGGDREPDENAITIWRLMAKGIIDGVGDRSKSIMTFHPQPFGSGSSSQWFHEDQWLDFNMLQTGHEKQKNTFDQIAADYALMPIKPVIDGEPTYEAHGLGFKPFEQGYSSDAEVRKFAYWSVFSGAFGHTYGCHSIWQFYSRDREGINHPIYEWKEALFLSGAHQMAHLHALMLSKPFLSRIPDQSLIVSLNEKNSAYVVATRDSNGTYCLVYAPTGKPFAIHTRSLDGKSIAYSWFNPKDGTSTMPIASQIQKEMSFVPPNKGYGNDWVLKLDCL